MSKIKIEVGKVYLDGYNNIIEIDNVVYWEDGRCNLYRAKGNTSFEYLEDGSNYFDYNIAALVDCIPYDEKGDLIKLYENEDVVSTDDRDKVLRKDKLKKVSVITKQMVKDAGFTVKLR